MKLRNSNGITLAVLVVTIIILIIISTVSIHVSFDLIKTARFENVKTDLLLIQSKCKIKAEQKAIGDIEEVDLYGTKQENEGEYNGWYLLSQEDLQSIGVEDADASDKYYVNYENDNVAYGKGIENDGKTYYKLSEILEDQV